MFQMNVCSLGWVIDSNMCVRSVACVSLSLPESANRWDRWKESPTGTGSNLWRGQSVPVLDVGLTQWYGPLVGLIRPRTDSAVKPIYRCHVLLSTNRYSLNTISY
jgi:hypothetical protein